MFALVSTQSQFMYHYPCREMSMCKPNPIPRPSLPPKFPARTGLIPRTLYSQMVRLAEPRAPLVNQDIRWGDNNPPQCLPLRGQSPLNRPPITPQRCPQELQSHQTPPTSQWRHQRLPQPRGSLRWGRLPLYQPNHSTWILPGRRCWIAPSRLDSISYGRVGRTSS